MEKKIGKKGFRYYLQLFGSSVFALLSFKCANYYELPFAFLFAILSINFYTAWLITSRDK